MILVYKMKNCYYCKNDKSDSEFDRIIKGDKEVLRGWCKDCCAKHKITRQKLFARIPGGK